MVKTSPAHVCTRKAAYILDCSPDDVVDKCRKGLIPGALKLGRYWHIPLNEVNKLKRQLAKKGGTR